MSKTPLGIQAGHGLIPVEARWHLVQPVKPQDGSHQDYDGREEDLQEGRLAGGATIPNNYWPLHG